MAGRRTDRDPARPSLSISGENSAVEIPASIAVTASPDLRSRPLRGPRVHGRPVRVWAPGLGSAHAGSVPLVRGARVFFVALILALAVWAFRIVARRKVARSRERGWTRRRLSGEQQRERRVASLPFVLGGDAGGARASAPKCGETISSVSQLPTNIASASVAEAARRRGPSSSKVGRLASSDSIEAGGFTPGTMLGGALPDRRAARARRHGRGLPRRRPEARPAGRAEVPAAGISQRDQERLERFYAEVRIARQVSHPNVCRVYDIGEVDGQHFLSMEYVDGEDLASLLQAHRPPAGGQGARDLARSSARASRPRTTGVCCTAT